MSDSFEAYYQCIRRCYRFGQKKPVTVKVVLSEPESAIYTNVLRKEDEAKTMMGELIEHMQGYELEELMGKSDHTSSDTAIVETSKDFTMRCGDCVEQLRNVDESSIGLSVFSPPFATLFSYSDSPKDLGNSRNYDEFFAHMGFLRDELARVMRPGRNVCVHCQQLPLTKIYDGRMGVKDFRGDLIRHFDGQGFTYHGEVAIDKCPQAQAIRTKAKGLMFVTKERDASDLRPAYADYILVFKRDGKNSEPVKSDVTNDEWIQWARPIWYGIKETDTLQYRIAREHKDEKHICPLQLETIERCVRLWSNKGDTVLSPFAGIGSEGYVSIKAGRRFEGVELKRSYFDQAVRNLYRAEKEIRSEDLDFETFLQEQST